MKKTLSVAFAVALLVVAGVSAATPQAAAEKTANEICTKKGLAGDLLTKCVQDEIKKNAPVNTPTTAAAPVPTEKPMNTANTQPAK
ncbi:MAG: hypothetical protein HY540_07230 [Deltaproteobacteria bacterium]|nr:hypothetical protein [Deltaproteobacteria bacterium]